jgi:hypothetical protein
MAYNSRLSYDTAASGETQSNIHAIIGRLESLIGVRNNDVQRALSDFDAEDVSGAYSDKERKWLAAAAETKAIIDLVKRTLSENDGTAHQAQSRARAAVDGIGAA